MPDRLALYISFSEPSSMAITMTMIMTIMNDMIISSICSSPYQLIKPLDPGGASWIIWVIGNV